MTVRVDSVKVIQHDKKIMRGEFRGDFTRDTFEPFDHYSRVLMQQGRVQLDADWNEQVSIILHKLRSLACDLGSEHWGPSGSLGFGIEIVDVDGKKDLSIAAGHYYVKGILCEAELDQNQELFRYSNQPDYALAEDHAQNIDKLLNKISQKKSLLVYLDVWERHITYVNDDTIREVALAGPDTATRAQIVWQVKAIHTLVSSTARVHPFKVTYQTFLDEISAEIKPGTGKLSARVKDKSKDDNDPCLVAPESRYRGAENQLYRVEIHNSGVVTGDEDDVTVEGEESKATFKWLRENASVIFPITKIDDTLVTLEHLGRDCRYGLKPNDWVEIIDDDYDLQNRAEHLLQIEFVDDENRQVILKNAPQSKVATDPAKHPYLRRWDQQDGNENGVEVSADWLDLEDGIQVQFKQQDSTPVYQTGDYWLIPARVATGDVEWPKDAADNPEALLPHGVVHHYAPLAIITANDAGEINGPIELRRILKQSWS